MTECIEPTTAPADAELTTRMGRAWRELRRGASTTVIRDRLFGIGPDHIEPAQMDVLDLLVQRDRWRMSDVAGALRVDPSTVTRMVQRMEAAGLALRSPGDGDGRVVTVELTAKGRAIHQSVAARREAILLDLLGELGDADGARLVELLERFIAVLDDKVAHANRTDVSRTAEVSGQ